MSVLRTALNLQSPPTETEATKAIAMAAYDQELEVWSANAGNKGQFKSTATYDVAWGDRGAPAPSLLMMVKTGGCHQEDQELLEFLNDVVQSAYDSTLLPHAKFFCVSLIHPGQLNKKYWPLMTQMTGNAALRLEPSKSVSERAPAPKKWIDLKARTIEPQTRTHLNQIFSGTQKAKFIGLYQRPGRLCINAMARVIQVGAPGRVFDVLIWEITSIVLDGTACPLNEWMP